MLPGTYCLAGEVSSRRRGWRRPRVSRSTATCLRCPPLPRKVPQQRCRSPNEPSQSTQPTGSVGSGLARARPGRLRHRRPTAACGTGTHGGAVNATGLPATGYRRPLGAGRLPQGRRPPAHRGRRRRSMQAALCHHARPHRRGHDASRRPGQGRGAAPERRARQQDLYRPGRRARRRAGPRSDCIRRPRADPALDGFGSAGPLRHHGLCPLRAGRRQAAG